MFPILKILVKIITMNHKFGKCMLFSVILDTDK